MVHQFSSGTYSNLFGAALRAPGRITCFTPMVANPFVALFPGTAPPRTGALLSYSRAAPCQRYVSHVTVAVALPFLRGQSLVACRGALPGPRLEDCAATETERAFAAVPLSTFELHDVRSFACSHQSHRTVDISPAQRGLSDCLFNCID